MPFPATGPIAAPPDDVMLLWRKVCRDKAIHTGDAEMPANLLKQAVGLVRSIVGTNGVATQLARIDGKLDALSRMLDDPGPMSQPVSPTEVHPAQPVDEKDFVAATLPDGVVFQLSTDRNSIDPWHSAVSANAWQGADWKFLMAWLKPGNVFFDLGANIGMMTIPAAVSGAQVTAFEMLGSNIAHLERAIMRNGLANITVVAGALSDRPDFVGLGGVSAWGMVTDDALVYVPTVVIDDYVRQKKIEHVDVIKIDIEGSELRALTGAEALLDRDHPDIILEVNSLTCGTFGSSYRDLFRLVVGHGYRIYRIFPDRLVTWTIDMVQEAVAPDYLVTIKDEEAIAARCGWPIRQVTDEDLIDSILASAQYEGVPRLHVLAVAERLPATVTADPRVARLLAEWKPLETDPVLDTIRIGCA